MLETAELRAAVFWQSEKKTEGEGPPIRAKVNVNPMIKVRSSPLRSRLELGDEDGYQSIRTLTAIFMKRLIISTKSEVIDLFHSRSTKFTDTSVGSGHISAFHHTANLMYLGFERDDVYSHFAPIRQS